MDRLLYTMTEAARLLSLSRSAIYREAAAGRLRTVRVGTALRVRATDLAAFVAELPERTAA